MLTYELKLAQYKGPIEELLGLIEERKLEINEISLAQVTEDFLHYLETITEDYKSVEATPAQGIAYMRLLADFIVVASRLIFIKSKSLLPNINLSAEDEAEIKDLEARLLMYRQFKPAIKLLNDMWRKGNRGMSRPYFLHIKGFLLRMSEQGIAPAFFYPGSGLTNDVLHAAIAGVQSQMRVDMHEEELVREKIVTLEEKITEIIARMSELKETSFARISGNNSRAEAVVAFLAILHLAREQIISIEQEYGNSDIIIKSGKMKNQSSK